jgi:predicted nuclease of predicted toxin-antitoxin system
VKFFIDECLSPLIARRLNELGEHEAVHPRDIGIRGQRDDQIVDRCIREDRVIVTQNAEDFRMLLHAVDLHPGLIILPAAGREGTWRLLLRVIDFLAARGDPMKILVNHVAEIDASESIKLTAMPKA